MAFLFRPAADKPIPAGAERVRVKGKECVRWSKRGGGSIVALVLPNGKCRIRSPVWWVEYRDSRGLRQREGVSRDRAAAEHRMAEIVRDVERQKGGLLPRSAMSSGETLGSLAAEYEQHLLDMGRTPGHAASTRRQIATVLADCRWTTAADVTLARWVRWVGEARGQGEGFSAETINHYLRSLRAFFRWLVRSARLPADPLAAAELLNADADRRIRRRVLSPDEFRRFIDSTRESDKSRVGLDGPSRAALYLMAARTGLRAAVLAGLTMDSLRLDDPVPHIPVEARRQKGRKELRVPIPRAVLDELRPWLGTRPHGEPLWPGNWHRHNHGGKLVRKDLRAAGIRPETADGVYDLHALRSQFITDLARAGVAVQVAQQLAGHSSPNLTAKHYTRLALEDLAAAADRICPEICSRNPKQPETTGTGKGKTSTAGKAKKAGD